MRTLLLCLILFLLFLVWERLALSRSLRRIPLRIAVTGTRGKSSVSRLLASILREDGRKVLAKTTGSQATILLPDGSQRELDRSVPPSILEQIPLVRRAARLKADCLIAEVMSIHPENHYVECRHILQPHIVAVTNVRRDHTEAMGETEDQIASVLSLDICPQSTVFLPENENHESFRAEALRCGARLLTVAAGTSAAWLQAAPELLELEFSDNLDLVHAIATHLGISRKIIIDGIRTARRDLGMLRIWRHRPDAGDRTCYLVNAFAANDPDSTLRVLSKAGALLQGNAGNTIGILNLRADRVPRTVQWICALKSGALDRFARLYVTGPAAGLVRRRVPGVQVLKAASPEAMMRIVCRGAPDGALIFGFGNVKGSGRLLIEYWNGIGEPYGI
jgi:poly-gamma-glutamate synthase PgsB/CapB